MFSSRICTVKGEHLSMPYDRRRLQLTGIQGDAHPQHPACATVLPVSGG